jgi:CheY-like chemotaxis protein/signal transduction histidine kinase/HAMP domain-containing protein
MATGKATARPAIRSNDRLEPRFLLQTLRAVKRGDFSRRLPDGLVGVDGQIAEAFNQILELNESLVSDLCELSAAIGVEGKTKRRASRSGLRGGWAKYVDSFNALARDVTQHTAEIVRVVGAVSQGDLSQTVDRGAGDTPLQGNFLRDAKTVNTMVDQLALFAEEVTRLARDVGVEGKLGGQADARGVAGTWRDLADNVNLMARNLTEQVRGIARVVTAVARGDLNQHLSLDAQGEIATLVETINSMTVTLSTFAAQVTAVARDVGVEGRLGSQADVPGAAGVWRDLTHNVNEWAGNLTNQVRAIGGVATAVTKGDLTQSIEVDARGELAFLRENLNQMIGSLADTTRINEEQDWLKTNLSKLTRMLQGQRSLTGVARQVMSELAPVVGAQHGVFYMTDPKEEISELKLFASYAHQERKNVANRFKFGEGLVGQCAFEKQRILLTDAPSDYIRISSGLGEAKPLSIVVVPILFEGETKGVIELASFARFPEVVLKLLEQLVDSLGIVIARIEAQMRTDELLKKSQELTEELQLQQEELQQTNEELEEKAKLLSEQKTEVETKNREVEEARLALAEKAEQLTLTSKYKSEFLANMSHELRTPLNSLLILSHQLAGNPEQNLTEKQVEYAQTIHASGTELLSLINEVLDLAKIESGTMAMDVSEAQTAALGEYVRRTFDEVAKEKGLELQVELDRSAPEVIATDQKRLQQVLRNLLSNAIKFTDTGSVTLRIATATSGWSGNHARLDRAQDVVAFSVRDTGIGITKDRQKLIFEAFQQAEGGSSRKHGGVGLGLSISREIATLLGGDLRVESVSGKGSNFTLYLPMTVVEAQHGRPPMAEGREQQLPPAPHRATVIAPDEAETWVPDDRDRIEPGDRVLLVIEDDKKFASVLVEQARAKGFKSLVAGGGSPGLALAKNYKPDAITLDLRLPDLHGWAVLDRLKHDPDTRHIPVHVMSVEEGGERGLHYGALAFLRKPAEPEELDAALTRLIGFVERRVRRLLVVEDDEAQAKAVVELIGNQDVETTVVSSGEQALTVLEEGTFDCLVLDLRLPDMPGFELMKEIRSRQRLAALPIIVYTGKELSEQEETELRLLAETIVVKDARSPERLLDETALFLHRVEADLPAHKRSIIRQVHERDPALAGRRVLIVDDDVRNIFAITGVLERHEMKVFHAENGKEGIRVLAENQDVDIVLMDIMMPEMDGYEAMRKIRENPRFRKIPIIALTAKAMMGDRDKCIDAGASDYIAKPLNPDQLVSLLRVWLHR